MVAWGGGTKPNQTEANAITAKQRIAMSHIIAWLSSQQLLASHPQLFQLRLRFRFDVTTEDRFGAAGAKGHSLVVRQKKFESVDRDKLFHLERPDGVESGRKFLHQLIF